MKKREVTDDAVARAAEALERWNAWPNCTASRKGVRAALESALNPPEEPEVVVTREMLDAGVWAAMGYPCHTENLARVAAGAIYRAMRGLEPKAGESPERRSGKDRK